MTGYVLRYKLATDPLGQPVYSASQWFPDAGHYTNDVSKAKVYKTFRLAMIDSMLLPGAFEVVSLSDIKG